MNTPASQQESTPFFFSFIWWLSISVVVSTPVSWQAKKRQAIVFFLFFFSLSLVAKLTDGARTLAVDKGRATGRYIGVTKEQGTSRRKSEKEKKREKKKKKKKLRWVGLLRSIATNLCSITFEVQLPHAKGGGNTKEKRALTLTGSKGQKESSFFLLPAVFLSLSR
ncbi:hypothetical protein BKA57DRAFT_120314 [Linnemannia elongata]|nr:hypothetical protein BKA57DRAFT_120314 [Linnemannia elongata]